MSLGIISIASLSISFKANRTALIIDWPKSLSKPVIGTKRPICIFSTAFADKENNKKKFNEI